MLWNAPVTLATRAVATLLADANTVVLKASELCPRTQGDHAGVGAPQREVRVGVHELSDPGEVLRGWALYIQSAEAAEECRLSGCAEPTTKEVGRFRDGERRDDESQVGA